MAISDENDRLTIIIPKKMKSELKQFAEMENRSLSNYIVKVLEEHLDGIGQVSMNFDTPQVKEEEPVYAGIDFESPEVKALLKLIEDNSKKDKYTKNPQD